MFYRITLNSNWIFGLGYVYIVTVHCSQYMCWEILREIWNKFRKYNRKHSKFIVDCFHAIFLLYSILITLFTRKTDTSHSLSHFIQFHHDDWCHCCCYYNYKMLEVYQMVLKTGNMLWLTCANSHRNSKFAFGVNTKKKLKQKPRVEYILHSHHHSHIDVLRFYATHACSVYVCRWFECDCCKWMTMWSW